MKNWFIKYKSYILIFIVISAVLAAAYFSGGTPKTDPAQNQVSDIISKTSEIQEKSISSESSMPEQFVSDDGVKEMSVSSVSENKTQSDVSDTEKNIGSSIIQSRTESSQKNNISSEISQSPHKTENTMQEVTFISEEDGNTSPAELSVESSADNTSELSLSEQTTVSESSAYVNYCTFTISCESALKNEKLNDKLRKILPQDGIILAETKLTFEEGESAFDLLKRVCRENGIHLEYSQIPLTGGAYIEGIANLYEFDCGSISGWMYSINDKFPAVGCSDSKLSDGDRVAFLYTCDLGDDIGNHYSGE